MGSGVAEHRGIYRLAVLAILLLALALRFWGIAHQLPYKSYIEEDEFIYTALKYGSGDLNPHWFFHPSLYTYLLFSLYAVYYLIGRAVGTYSGVEQYLIRYLTDPTPWYLIARSLSALLVVPALLLIETITRALFSRRCALAACAFFAVMPLGVVYAHYGCTEPLLMVFALLAARQVLRACETGSARHLVLAGVCAGLAAGTKYIGVLAVVTLLAARGNVRKGFGRSLLAAGIAFLAVCPFPLLTPREYVANIALLLSQPLSVGELGWVKTPNLHLAFLTRYMPEGMGMGMASAAIAGTVYLLLSRRRRYLLVAALPAVFYCLIGFSRLYYDRYMLICYPFFAIAAAAFIEAVAALIPRRSGLCFILLCAAIALPSLHDSIGRVRDMVLPDTSVLAAEWIGENLAPGRRVLAELVPLPRTEESIAREQRMKTRSPRRAYGYRKMTSLFFELERRAARGKEGFDVTRILHPRGFHMVPGGKGYEAEWMTPKLMRETLGDLSRYDYALLSEFHSRRYGGRDTLPARFTFMADFYDEVRGRGTLVRVFKPEAGMSRGSTFLLYALPGKGSVGR